MEKHQNIDIIATLDGVVERNTVNYKSDFNYDVDMFKAAAENPDGENNRFLWLSRHSGTECFNEYDVYIKDTQAFYNWQYYADRENESIHAYAVEVTGFENERVMGNLYKFDYPQHAKEVEKSALPPHSVNVKFGFGKELNLSFDEYQEKQSSLIRDYGNIVYYKVKPQDTKKLQDILKQVRDLREKKSRTTVKEKRDIMKQLEFTGVDNWDRPVYQDESGQLWKDVNLGRGEPDLHSAVNNDFYGEPDMPIKGEFEIINTQPEKSNTLQEARQGLNEEVENTLQFFIDSDMENHGALSPDTLEAIKVQGYEYNGVNLVQVTEQPEATKSIYYPINEETARQAKQANSFYDYKQGSATAGYQASVDKAVEIAEKQKKHVDPQYHDKIDRLVDTYARKLAANINHRNAIDCRVPSIMIAGGSNFPVRKKEKQNAARDTNMREWSDIQGLLDKIKSVGTGGISADDPNAINRLQEKLESLQDSQEAMKAVNAYYRKHKTLDGCPHLSEKNLATLKADMSRSWRSNPKPFESYALSNNNANIRNVKERIEQLKSKEKIEFTGWQFDGGNVEVNKKDNRLQVFFDEKPDADTRTELKKNGFKWSPNAGAWQRQLTDNAFWGADYVKAIQPLTGEKPTDLYRAARAEAKQEQPAEPAHQPEQAPQPAPEVTWGGTFKVYQLKDVSDTRGIRFESFENLKTWGVEPDIAKYDDVHTGSLSRDELKDPQLLENIFENFNTKTIPAFGGRSLSVSDVIVIKDGEEKAFYCDSVGFVELPHFTEPPPPKMFVDLNAAARDLQKTYDALQAIKPYSQMSEGACKPFSKWLTQAKERIPDNQPMLKALFSHAAESTDFNMLKERMELLKSEFLQHYPAAPTLAELDKAVNNGETISILDLYNAIKKEGLPEKPKPKKAIAARIENAKTTRESAPEKSEPTATKNRKKDEPDL